MVLTLVSYKSLGQGWPLPLFLSLIILLLVLMPVPHETEQSENSVHSVTMQSMSPTSPSPCSPVVSRSGHTDRHIDSITELQPLVERVPVIGCCNALQWGEQLLLNYSSAGRMRRGDTSCPSQSVMGWAEAYQRSAVNRSRTYLPWPVSIVSHIQPSCRTGFDFLCSRHTRMTGIYPLMSCRRISQTIRHTCLLLQATYRYLQESITPYTWSQHRSAGVETGW